LLEVLSHYANTGKETLSPFIDSSNDNVHVHITIMFMIMIMFQSRLYQSLLDFTNVPKPCLVDTLLHDS